MKQFRMLVIGLFAGVLLTISATAFAAGGISKIEAYLREGFTFKVNGQVATLENTPIVYNDTSYMPVRELAGMLGYEVGFEDNTITLDAKQPQAMPAATEQVKDVGDVTTTTTTTDEWVSLRDLANNKDLFIGQTSDSNGQFRVMRGDKLLFSLDYSDNTVSAKTPDGKDVRVRKTDTGTDIFRADIVEFGLTQ